MAFLLLWQVEASDTHGRRPSTKEGSSWGHSERRISLAASLSFLDSISAVNVDESDDDFFSKRDVPASNTDQFTQYLEQNMDEEKRTNVESYLKATPEDEKERLEVIRKENEAVKDLIENFNNPFLLKYIKQYWEDYDSVQSNEAIGRSFQQLTERELNQLQQESSCHVC